MKKVSRRTEIIIAIVFSLCEVTVILWFGSAFAILGQLQGYAIGFCLGVVFYPVIPAFAGLLKERLRIGKATESD